MAKKGYSRVQRVEDLIQTALAEILLQHTEELEIGMVTITSVEVSPDFSHAKIFVSVLDDDTATEAVKILNENNRNFRYELAHAVKIRVTPELKFIYDDSSVRGSRISSLINNALKQEKPSQED